MSWEKVHWFLWSSRFFFVNNLFILDFIIVVYISFSNHEVTVYLASLNNSCFPFAFEEGMSLSLVLFLSLLFFSIIVLLQYACKVNPTNWRNIRKDIVNYRLLLSSSFVTTLLFSDINCLWFWLRCLIFHNISACWTVLLCAFSKTLLSDHVQRRWNVPRCLISTVPIWAFVSV